MRVWVLEALELVILGSSGDRVVCGWGEIAGLELPKELVMLHEHSDQYSIQNYRACQPQR